jgi:polysaccharide pyruvyl transferase WcaK-like protein
MRTDRDSAKVVAAHDWIRAQREGGRTIVGVNANIEPFRALGSGADELVAVHAATVGELIAERSCACLFVSHDWRAAPQEQELAERVRSSLATALRDCAHVVEGPHSAMEAKGVCAELDFLVSGRMHLAIGALTHAVPTAFLPYQGKFEGLTQHLGAEELVLDVARSLDERTLIGQVAPLLDRRDALRREIAARMPQILELSRSNLDEPRSRASHVRPGSSRSRARAAPTSRRG